MQLDSSQLKIEPSVNNLKTNVRMIPHLDFQEVFNKTLY